MSRTKKDRKSHKRYRVIKNSLIKKTLECYSDEIVNITLIMEYGYETINTYIDDYSINSIVTKEQFEQMTYKVGEQDE